LTEETDWVGSQLTNQAAPADEHSWIEEYGVTPDTDPAARHPGLLSRPRADCLPGPSPSQPGQRVAKAAVRCIESRRDPLSRTPLGSITSGSSSPASITPGTFV